jgi:hypothetical protein
MANKTQTSQQTKISLRFCGLGSCVNDTTAPTAQSFDMLPSHSHQQPATFPRRPSAAAVSMTTWFLCVQLLPHLTTVDGLYETGYDDKMRAKSNNCQFFRYANPAVEQTIRLRANQLVRKAAVSPVREHNVSQGQGQITPFGSIERFVLFFGHQRTGHSYIGAVIDGAPDTLISNEYNALSKFHKFPKMTRAGLFTELAVNSIRCNRYGRVQVYNYSIPGVWQGQIAPGNVLRIIGDKKGGTTTKLTYQLGIPFLNRFMEFVALPFECIYVIRNPFDMIATVTVHQHPQAETVITEDVMQWAEESVDQNMNLTKATASVIIQPHRWHVIFMEDFSERTAEELPRLCKLIGVSCPDMMVPLIDAATHHDVHRSRHEVKWAQSQIDRIDSLLRKYPLLYKRYGPGNGLDGAYPIASDVRLG